VYFQNDFIIERVELSSYILSLSELIRLKIEFIPPNLKK